MLRSIRLSTSVLDGTTVLLGLAFGGEKGRRHSFFLPPGHWVRRFVAGALVTVSTLAAAVTPMVAARLNHALVLKDDGTVVAWGNDSDGAIGAGRALFSPTPSTLAGLPTIKSVSAYTNHVLALDTQGNVWAWGSNAFGQLGRRNERNPGLPDRVQGIANVKSVAATDLFSVALTQDGKVWIWGAPQYVPVLDPFPVEGLSDIVQIAGGLQHVLALRSDGALFAFGFDGSGELGNGTVTSSITLTPFRIDIAPVANISAGNTCSMALTVDGRVFGWGRLAGFDFTTPPLVTPQEISGFPARPVALACNLNAYVALANGEVWRYARNAPLERVSGFNGISGISVAHALFDTVLGVTPDKSLYVLTDNRFGQAGLGNTVSGQVQRVPLANVVQASAGDDVMVALSDDGKVWTWGRDAQGALGTGSRLFYPTPHAVAGLSGIVKIAAIGMFEGGAASLALDDHGNVWVWGNNTNGALGLGGLSPVSVPTRLPITGVVDIAAGTNMLIMLKGDKTVWVAGCCLAGYNGTPGKIEGLPPVEKIAGGFNALYVIDGQGNAFALGDNTVGELGDGNVTNATSPATSPVTVKIPEPVAQIAADYQAAIAVTRSGRVYAWGSNSNHVLGTSTPDIMPTPTPVPGLSNVVEVAASNDHYLARLADGTLMSWGVTFQEALGRDSADPTPAPVRDLDGVISIAANSAASYAIRSDGTVWGWGYNSTATGLVGDGTFTPRARPVVMFREDGAGTLDAKNWFLDTKPNTAKAIPPGKVPALLASASASDLGAVANVDAILKFRSKDIGKGIRIFAYAPEGLTKGTKDGACVLAQLTTSGLQPATDQVLQVVGNVQANQQAAVTILNNVPTTQIAGATFCVGSGTTGAEAVDPANSQCVVTAPGGQACAAPQAKANAPGLLSGLWYNPSESGWGIYFSQRRDVVFAAWYTYDLAGNPKWYVASNCRLTSGTDASGTCDGALYEVSGPSFFGTGFDPARVNVATAGSMEISFQNPSTAILNYTLGTQKRTVGIEREVFQTGSAPPAVDYTDLWWNPDESGWGLAITQQYAVMFLAWYVYDAAGNPVWYVAADCAVSGDGCSGPLYRTTGPPQGPTFDATRVQVIPAGSVSVRFSDANNGTLSYTVNGVSSSKGITRQLF